MKNTLYTRVVIITISLIVLNQCFIQFWLFNKRADANTINLSGRQRMLSQRLLNLTQAYRDKPDVVRLEDIQTNFTLWEHTHYQLIEEATNSFVDGLLGIDVTEDLKALTPRIEIVQAMLQAPLELASNELEVFRQNQDAFLFSMNAIVDKLEKLSNRKLAIVIVAELLFALFSLIVVYYEIIYVFRRINRSLERKNAELQTSNHLLEQYAYLAAHDLKSPSQNLLNFATLLQSKTASKLNVKENQYLDFVIQSAKRLLDTTSDLLRFSSFSQQKLNISTIQPESLIKEVLKNLEATINEKSASVEIGLMVDEIKVDEKMLFAVFQNLISNALKFVPKEVKPHIQIKYIPSDDVHQFLVVDNGIGIEKQYQQTIFGLFKRLNSVKDYEGTGIGLAICQRNINRHGGEISVESALGKGSSFIFSIPKHPSFVQ